MTRRRPVVAVAVALACGCAFAAQALATKSLGAAGGVHYQSATHFFDPPDRPSVTATCPSQEHVAGGTYVIFDPKSPDTFLANASIPVDGHDGDHRPDDGWKVKGSSIPLRAGANTIAMCTKDRYRYRVKHEPVPAGYPPSVKLGCGGKKWHVTGGGASVPRGDNLTASFPFDSGDHGDRPDDGWAARAYVPNPNAKLSVYAICEKKSPEYHKASRILNPGEGASADPQCSPHGHLIGAGGNVGGSPTFTTLRDVEATDDPTEPGDVPDDAVYAFGELALASPTPQTFTAYAICAK